MISRKLKSPLIWVALLLVACIRRPAFPAPDGAAAVIGRDSAFFVFPAEPTTRLQWNLPRRGKGAGSADRTWLVAWAADAIATDSATQIAVDRRYRPGESPRAGTLAQLLAETVGEEGSRCWRCEPPAVVVTRRPEISARAQDNRVVIIVHGRELVRHLFWSQPARVTLRWTGALTGHAEAKVEYR
jgi:hypothetical protein